MALALYRRYRPDTFDGVIGQDQVTVPLMRALDENKLTHAYLFSGPRGCGKTSSARILARCVNCAKGPTSHPCGECESCKDLATGGPGSIDVVEIDAASHNGVDDARELRERAGFAPARDRYKIFILDEAHMSKSAKTSISRPSQACCVLPCVPAAVPCETHFPCLTSSWLVRLTAASHTIPRLRCSVSRLTL